ncbi:uncharacterized protein PITG_23172 [Phytophthora infestans T30-4]|uniref:Uncharacterized protein n=1 Tax=Phytophthora infestans (strain T30-4) TaxID=403677 RepID=D0P102_PHYIT|nr:uncharacterized protein PITG_23172 [Phytophthora infestans T30-4]EEY53712.1 conserved hypothetical protein [Phytophthora infestans T30-4]|eukprot:XP_002896025.1 conserved hypothetical protein [Phytophthora infestans T30-4]
MAASSSAAILWISTDSPRNASVSPWRFSSRYWSWFFLIKRRRSLFAFGPLVNAVLAASVGPPRRIKRNTNRPVRKADTPSYSRTDMVKGAPCRSTGLPTYG